MVLSIDAGSDYLAKLEASALSVECGGPRCKASGPEVRGDEDSDTLTNEAVRLWNERKEPHSL